MLRLEPHPQPSRLMFYLTPVFAILLTLAAGVVLFSVLRKPPLEALALIFIAPLTTLRGLAELTVKATPLILRPWRVLLGAYLFGGITVLQLHSQALGAKVDAQLLSMLPYLATVVVLVLISRDTMRLRLNAPACPAKPFHATI